MRLQDNIERFVMKWTEKEHRRKYKYVIKYMYTIL